MKRFWFLLLAGLVLFPAAASAQSVGWNLTQTFHVTDLKIQFNFPDGWFLSTSGGIAFAETQADIDAQTDDDPDTLPTGTTLNFTAVPLAKFNLPTTATLEDAVQKVIDVTKIQLDQNAEALHPILGHRTIVITGALPTGRYSSTAIWLDDGNLVFVSLGTADKNTNINFAISFVDFLGTFAPLNPLALDAPVELTSVPGYSMSFPTGWKLVPGEQLELYQHPEDQTAVNGKITGIALLLVRTPVADFQSQLNLTFSTLTDIMAFIVSSTGLQEPLQRSDLKLFDQPALGVLGQSANGTWGRAVLGIVGENAYTFIIAAPDQQTMSDFQPTWIAMLQSIQPVQKP